MHFTETQKIDYKQINNIKNIRVVSFFFFEAGI